MITNIQTLMPVPLSSSAFVGSMDYTLYWCLLKTVKKKFFFNGLGVNLRLCAYKARTFPLSHIPCLCFVFSYKVLAEWSLKPALTSL